MMTAAPTLSKGPTKYQLRSPMLVNAGGKGMRKEQGTDKTDRAACCPPRFSTWALSMTSFSRKIGTFGVMLDGTSMQLLFRKRVSFVSATIQTKGFLCL